MDSRTPPGSTATPAECMCGPMVTMRKDEGVSLPTGKAYMESHNQAAKLACKICLY